MGIDSDRRFVPVTANSTRHDLTFPNFIRIFLDALQYFGSVRSTLVGIHNIKRITTFYSFRTRLNFLDHSSIDEARLDGAVLDGVIADVSAAAQPSESLPSHVLLPPRYLFDAVVQKLISDQREMISQVEQAYEPALTPHENLPGGRLQAGQRAFVDNVWLPKEIAFNFGVTFAAGSYAFRYNREFYDYETFVGTSLSGPCRGLLKGNRQRMQVAAVERTLSDQEIDA